jgi:hypothetical protein
VLVHDPALAEVPELLAAAGGAVRLALDNARPQAEVRAHLAEVKRPASGWRRWPTSSAKGWSATCTMGPSSGSSASASRWPLSAKPSAAPGVTRSTSWNTN